MCVTTVGVARSPWVNFEAGAISKYVEHAHVSPLLIQVSPEDLNGLPLSRFQCTKFNEQDVGRLLQSINKVARRRLIDKILKRNLRYTWSQLQEEVGEIGLSEVPDSEDDDEDYYDDDDYYDESDESRVFLEEIEENILELVAKCELRRGWSRPNVDEVCNLMQDNQIRIQHYLDRLVEAGLLHRHLNTVSPTTYSATKKGRAYLVDNDLV